MRCDVMRRSAGRGRAARGASQLNGRRLGAGCGLVARSPFVARALRGFGRDAAGQIKRISFVPSSSCLPARRFASLPSLFACSAASFLGDADATRQSKQIKHLFCVEDILNNKQQTRSRPHTSYAEDAISPAHACRIDSAADLKDRILNVGRSASRLTTQPPSDQRPRQLSARIRIAIQRNSRDSTAHRRLPLRTRSDRRISGRSSTASAATSSRCSATSSRCSPSQSPTLVALPSPPWVPMEARSLVARTWCARRSVRCPFTR